MKTIRVRLKERSYDILVGKGLLKSCGRQLKSLDIGKDAVVITNSRVATLFKKPLIKSLRSSGFTALILTVPDSEKAKSIRTLMSIIDHISRYDVGRRIFILALGGGVVGDVAGFAAATYKRGIPYIQVPTTLLAQVDSSIGGKTAVDLPVAKNMVGAFYQPRLVISDTQALKTLPAKQIKSGIAEVIKYGVIRDRGLFEFLEENREKILGLDEGSLEFIVSRSTSIKADIVSKDEFDRKKIRAVLNFGHTIGHAVEAASGYSGYSHGEAVAIGMAVASKISERLGILPSKDAARIIALIKKFGLPTRIRKDLDFSDIYSAHQHDKKFSKTNCLVLPSRIGHARVMEDVPDNVIRKVIKESLL
jgi:3-dehydroquinate synthase